MSLNLIIFNYFSSLTLYYNLLPKISFYISQSIHLFCLNIYYSFLKLSNCCEKCIHAILVEIITGNFSLYCVHYVSKYYTDPCNNSLLVLILYNSVCYIFTFAYFLPKIQIYIKIKVFYVITLNFFFYSLPLFFISLIMLFSIKSL